MALGSSLGLCLLLCSFPVRASASAFDNDDASAMIQSRVKNPKGGPTEIGLYADHANSTVQKSEVVDMEEAEDLGQTTCVATHSFTRRCNDGMNKFKVDTSAAQEDWWVQCSQHCCGRRHCDVWQLRGDTCHYGKYSINCEKAELSEESCQAVQSDLDNLDNQDVVDRVDVVTRELNKANCVVKGGNQEHRKASSFKCDWDVAPTNIQWATYTPHNYITSVCDGLVKRPDDISKAESCKKACCDDPTCVMYQFDAPNHKDECWTHSHTAGYGHDGGEAVVDKAKTLKKKMVENENGFVNEARTQLEPDHMSRTRYSLFDMTSSPVICQHSTKKALYEFWTTGGILSNRQATSPEKEAKDQAEVACENAWDATRKTKVSSFEGSFITKGEKNEVTGTFCDNPKKLQSNITLEKAKSLCSTDTACDFLARPKHLVLAGGKLADYFSCKVKDICGQSAGLEVDTPPEWFIDKYMGKRDFNTGNIGRIKACAANNAATDEQIKHTILMEKPAICVKVAVNGQCPWEQKPLGYTGDWTQSNHCSLYVIPKHGVEEGNRIMNALFKTFGKDTLSNQLRISPLGAERCTANIQGFIFDGSYKKNQTDGKTWTREDKSCYTINHQWMELRPATLKVDMETFTYTLETSTARGEKFTLTHKMEPDKIEMITEKAAGFKTTGNSLVHLSIKDVDAKRHIGLANPLRSIPEAMHIRFNEKTTTCCDVYHLLTGDTKHFMDQDHKANEMFTKYMQSLVEQGTYYVPVADTITYDGSIGTG